MTAHSASRASRLGGRRAAGGHRVCSIVLGILCLLTVSRSTAADSSPIKLVPVNASEPDTWPEGDWVPIRGRKLRDLVSRSQPAPNQPRTVWIERATYSAVFDGTSLKGGRLTADIRHDAKQGQLLSLEPLNLAVSKMGWVEQPAVWGTLGNGRTALYVDGEHSTLVGNWSLAGRQLPRSVEFDVQVPSAAVNRLRLIVREGDLVSASTGVGRWIELKGQTGLRQWELDLGSQTRCRLKIRDRPDQTNVTPLVLSQSTHSYVVRDDGVQLQAEFLLEAANAPVNVFLFSIPAGVDIHSVSYGSNSSPAWRLIPDADNQLLAVQLADPLSGASRPIRIDGTATTRLARKWHLPQLRLQLALQATTNLRAMRNDDFGDPQAKTRVNPVFLQGDVHLKIDSPLELQSVKSKGLRQTATVSTPDVSRSLSFQQYLPDAELTLNVGLPELRRSVNLLSYVDTSEENWTLTSHITLSADAGQTFDAEFRLAPLWEVIEVRPRDDSSQWTDWDVRRRKGGGRILSIEFRDAIAPGMPKAVEVVARRLPLSKLRPLRLPFLRPLNHGFANQVIAVSHAAISVDQPDPPSSYRTFAAEKPPEFVVGSELWQRIETAGEGELLLVQSNEVGDQGELRLGQSGPAAAAEVWTTVNVGASEVRETFNVRLRPTGEAIDRVRVYLSVADGEVEWKRDLADGEVLTANRISPVRRGDIVLPAGGELWEIEFPRAFRREVSIVGSRVRSNSSSLMATLATVPGAESFEGVIELQAADGVYVTSQVEGPVAVEPENLKSEFSKKRPESIGRVWRYQSHHDSLQLRLRGDSDELQYKQTAVLKLQSILSGEFPGFDRHRATLKLLDSRRHGEIRFELPRPAVLLSTRLNGKLVTPYRRDKEWVVAHPEEDKSTTIQIEYQSSSGGGHFIRREAIPLPKCAYTILDFHWEFATPPDTWIVNEPNGMVMLDQLPQLSWTERFFGPLGRPVENTMFNPFSSHSWSSLRGARLATSGKASPDTSDRFSPEGWEINRANSPFLPGQLVVVTRRHSTAWLLAWVGTLWCLLVGLLMRFRQSEIRKSVFGYWLSICLFAAWLSPPFYALIAGGCVVGTVVALLLPRRLLERLHFSKKPTDIVPGGSTASIRRAPVVTLLLIAALTAAQSFAQQPPGGGSRRSTNSTRAENDAARLFPIRALAPGGTAVSEIEDQDIVYVENNVLKVMRRVVLRRDAASDYLVSSAKYSATVDDRHAVVVDADYVVYLLPGVKSARIGFPTALANPGQCRVNGKVHPIVLADDGRKFLVEVGLPADGTADIGLTRFEINLEFRPATRATESGHSYRLNVIDVASAQLEQKFSKPVQTIEVDGSHGEQIEAPDRRSLSVLLGKTQQFHVLWSDNSEPGQARAHLEAAVTSRVMVRPTWLETRYRIDYRVLSGQVDFVAWNLPRGAEGMVVQNVMLDGAEVEAFSTTTTSDTSMRLLIEFSSSQDSDFVVEAVVVQPIVSNDRGVVSLAAVSIVDESAQPYEVNQTRNLLALSAPPEFDVSAPAPERLGSGIREIDVETYRELTGEKQAVRPIRIAYEVLRGASRVPVTLTPVAPVRKVRLIQTGTIRRDVLHWSLTADVETSRAPVFRHRLKVPAALSITEISVREDNAERLVHWSRQGDLVELFLSDKSNGIQSLLLNGDLGVSRGTSVALPLIEIEQAELTSSRLRLLREPRVSVELIGIESFVPIENGIAAIAEARDLQLLGQFRVPGDAVAPQIKVTPQSEQIQSHATVLLARHGQKQLQVDYRYQFLSGDGGRATDPILMTIPAGIADRMRVESPGASIVRKSLPDETVELRIAAKTGSTAVLDVRVIIVVDEPPPGDWLLPRIDVVDVDERELYLIVPDELGLQPVGRNTKSVSEQALPRRVRQLMDVGVGSAAPGIYQIESLDVSFFVGLSDTRPKPSQITLMESQISHVRQQKMFGQTTVWISHLDEDEVEFEWPREAMQRAVFVDGVQVVAIVRDPPLSRIAIPIATGRGPHRVVIHWSAAIEGTTSRWSLQRQPLPVPHRIAVNRAILKIVPPHGMFYSTREELSIVDDWDYALDRFQGVYDVNLAQVAGNRNQPLWNEMQSLRQSLQKRLSKTDEGADISRHRERFDTINRAVAELEAQLANETPAVQLTGQEETDARPVLSFDLTAPNRSTVEGRIGPGPTDTQRRISFWAFGNWVVAVILLLLGLPLIPLIRWAVRKEIGQWLFRHQPAAWALLGILWWTCLRPSEVGLILLLVSLIVAVWEWRRVRKETDFVVDISTDESENLVTSSP